MRYIEADYKESERRTILVIGGPIMCGDENGVDSKGTEQMIKYYREATNTSIYSPYRGYVVVTAFGRRRKFEEESDKWNDTCPICGAPAYKGFTKIECSRGCK